MSDKVVTAISVLMITLIIFGIITLYLDESSHYQDNIEDSIGIINDYSLDCASNLKNDELISPLALQGILYNCSADTENEEVNVFAKLDNGYKSFEKSKILFKYPCFSIIQRKDYKNKRKFIEAIENKTSVVPNIKNYNDAYVSVCKIEDRIENGYEYGNHLVSNSYTYKENDLYHVYCLYGGSYNYYFIQGDIDAVNFNDLKEGENYIAVKLNYWASQPSIKKLKKDFNYDSFTGNKELAKKVYAVCEFDMKYDYEKIIDDITCDYTLDNYYLCIMDKESNAILAVGKLGE